MNILEMPFANKNGADIYGFNFRMENPIGTVGGTGIKLAIMY